MASYSPHPPLAKAEEFSMNFRVLSVYSVGCGSGGCFKKWKVLVARVSECEWFCIVSEVVASFYQTL